MTLSSRTARLSSVLTVFVFLSAPAGAASWSLEAVAPGLCTGAEPVPCNAAALFSETSEAVGATSDPRSPELIPAPRKAGMPLWAKNVLLTAGVSIGIGVITHADGWGPGGRRSFNTVSEGFFSASTYAGGADKASHFVFSWLGQEAGEWGFAGLGNGTAESRLLGVGVSIATGLLVELADGFTVYGFSWEDFATDAAGALASFGVSALDLRDTVGVRFGFVHPNLPPPGVPLDRPNNPNDYSNQVHTLDLKLAGFLPRVGVRKPGPARYLLVSVRWDTQGYHFHPPEERQQNIGFEVGLDVAGIVRGLGLRSDRLWKKAILGFLDYFRLPFTSIGYRYDLIHGRWHGPAAGINF